MTHSPDIDAPEGQHQAHTRAAPGASAPPAAAIELGGADPGDLLAGSPDLEAQDVLALVAEISAGPRRARGRPAGAANRKNADMIGYLAALGHRDPWVTLSLIQSADFKALCKMVGADTAKTKLAVLDVQRRAADRLMEYHHAKKPVQLELPNAGDKRPLMAIGDLDVHVHFSADVLSVDPQQNQRVIEGESVRQGEAVPHDASKPLRDKALSDEST